MQVKPFRSQPKEHVVVRLPTLLLQRLRVRKATSGRSHSELVAESLARMFGEDPAAYGIDVGPGPQST